MFSFRLLRGNPKTVLTDPGKIVISQKLAKNYFGDTDPIGKIVQINEKRSFQVEGIMEDVPQNSSLKFDFVLPLQATLEDNQWMTDGWGHFGPATYVMLQENASPETVKAKIKRFLAHKDPKLDDKLLSLQPYKDMYLYSRFTKGVADGGRIEYVRLFSIIAIFILLIACINFTNLAIARSVKRAKEVGVRKVVGAGKGLVFGQFMAEAIMTAFLAVLLGILLVILLYPLFNSLTGKDIALPFLNPYFLIGVIGLGIVTGFAAGSYPALFLSSLKPISILKTSLKFGTGAILFRKGLVVFQFALSIILIISTFVIYRQMNYIQNKNLGLDRENVLYMSMEGDLTKSYEAFRNDVLASGNIEEFTQSSSMPTNVGTWSYNVGWRNKDTTTKRGFVELSVYYGFLQAMRIQLVQGRDFSRSFVNDSSNYLVNEEAVKVMGLKDPIGEMFIHRSDTGKIIGVVKDFHLRSLHDPIAPLFISFNTDFRGALAVVRTKPGRTKEALSTLSDAYHRFNPKYPFDYRFADDEFNAQYKSEIMVGKLVYIFSFLAIFISAMGLFGLAMFIVEQRVREIGIRKVLGASVSGIVSMLTLDFVKLVLLSALLAFPLAYWIMNKWLQAFAYRVALSWWIFLLAATIALVIALITVGFQTVKAALTNPVKSLKNE
jgi:ABC-type antimicrobial peptide transport system permease subunit